MGLELNDLNTYDGKHTVYPVVNESVNVWREALRQIPTVKRAGAISSGGEISFFCVAPRVREKLILLDHSYQSIYFALGKFHLIDKLGSKEAFRALVKNDRKVLKELFVEANKGLPTEAPPVPKEHEAYENAIAKWNDDYREWEAKYAQDNPTSWRRYDNDFHYAYQDWNRAHPKPTPPANYRSSYRNRVGFDGLWGGATTQYEEVTQAGITEFRKHRHKLEFVHGDLTDLEVLGPFDLIYLSNALSYSGRNATSVYDVTKWVKPGGYVCLTYSSYSYDKPPRAIPKEAELVFEYGREPRRRYDSYGRIVPGNDTRTHKTRIPTRYGSQWAYGIYKVPE